MEEVKISGKRSSHTIENLKCGTKYALSLIAMNKVGRSDPSQVLSVSTTGNGKLSVITVLNIINDVILFLFSISSLCPFHLQFDPKQLNLCFG